MLLLCCNLTSALRDVGLREEKEEYEEEIENENGNMVVLGAIAWSPDLAFIQKNLFFEGRSYFEHLLAIARHVHFRSRKSARSSFKSHVD